MTASIIDGNCAYCGPAQIHAGTGRCQRCGRDAGASAISGLQNGHMPNPVAGAAPVTKPEPFRLPASAKTRAWIEQTRQLRDGFIATAEQLEEEAKATGEEAARFRKAASAFTQLLQQIDVEPGPAASGQSKRSTATGRVWKVAECEHCHTVKKIFARGMCARCFHLRKAEGSAS